MLHHFPGMRYWTSRKPGAFFDKDDYEIISDGINVHFGWKQSLKVSLGPSDDDVDEVSDDESPIGRKLAGKQLLLNMDATATAFYISGILIIALATF